MWIPANRIKPLLIDKDHGVIFRRASHYCDFGKIYDLSKECFDYAYSMAAFWNYLGYWPHLCLATDFKGELLGFILGATEVAFEKPKTGSINMLAVKKSARFIGIASNLLKILLNMFATEFCVSVRLDTAEMNLIAQNLYTRFGFCKENLNINFYSVRKNGFNMVVWLKVNTRPMIDKIASETEQFDKEYPTIIDKYANNVANLSIKTSK